MLRQPDGLMFVTAPAPREPTLRYFSTYRLKYELYLGISQTHRPPTAPPKNENPFETARYFRGRISDGMAWTMEIVASVTPIRIPPTINIVIDEALADMTAPTKAIKGGILARYLRSRTSDSRPTIGERTLCIKSGPWIL